MKKKYLCNSLRNGKTELGEHSVVYGMAKQNRENISTVCGMAKQQTIIYQ
jgi:hypothetical protein